MRKQRRPTCSPDTLNEVVFRVDAASFLGTGHVMRCLALAELLNKRGINTKFICCRWPGNLIALLGARRQNVSAFDAIGGVSEILPFDPDCYRAHECEDAAQTSKLIGFDKPDWLIVDHYGLGQRWERQMSSHAARIAVVDDLMDRRHLCDLLIDQNLRGFKTRAYASLVPSKTRVLLGPRYSLLDPNYATIRSRMTGSSKKHVEKIVIFFGGVDPFAHTAMALDVLQDPEFSGIEAAVVIGSQNKHAQAIADAARQRRKTSVFTGLPHLAELLSTADLAIGAGGVSMWERMCLGVPSIVFSIAHNQRESCEQAAVIGSVKYISGCDSRARNELKKALRQCVSDSEMLTRMADRCSSLVDGLGVDRVAEHLFQTETTLLSLRRAERGDLEFYFDLVNDPLVRYNSIKTDPISRDEHRKWFQEKLRDKNAHLFVLTAGRLPVGQVRLDEKDGSANLDYAVDPDFRGRGWGTVLLGQAVHYAWRQGIKSITADVKEANIPSCKVLSKSGFKELSTINRSSGCKSFIIERPAN